MILTLIEIILIPFAAISVVFTGAIGIAATKTLYDILKKKKNDE